VNHENNHKPACHFARERKLLKGEIDYERCAYLRGYLKSIIRMLCSTSFITKINASSLIAL